MMTLSYINWDVDPEIANFFGITLRYYGILFVGGLLLCIYILKGIFKKEQIAASKLEKLAIYGMIGIFAGARLGHCLFYEPSYYLTHPLEIFLPVAPAPGGGFRFTGYQGLASHGGALGLLMALVIYARRTKEPLLKTLDIIAIVAPLGAFFIRLANLMNSEIIGIPAKVPWAFVFVREDQLPRHPAQLYEAIAYLLIFVLLFFLFKTGKFKPATGFFFGVSVLLIFTARFFIEFLKEKQVPFEAQMQLDMGQVLSIPLIIAGIVFIVYALRRPKAAVAPPSNELTEKY